MDMCSQQQNSGNYFSFLWMHKEMTQLNDLKQKVIFQDSMGQLDSLSGLCQFIWYLRSTGVSAGSGRFRIVALTHLLLADWLT